MSSFIVHTLCMTLFVCVILFLIITGIILACKTIKYIWEDDWK